MSHFMRTPINYENTHLLSQTITHELDPIKKKILPMD